MATSEAVHLPSVNSSDSVYPGQLAQASDIYCMNCDSTQARRGKFIMVQRVNPLDTTTYYIPFSESRFEYHNSVNLTIHSPSPSTHIVSRPASQTYTSSTAKLRPQRTDFCYSLDFYPSFQAFMPPMTDLSATVDFHGGNIYIDDPRINILCSGTSTACQ